MMQPLCREVTDPLTADNVKSSLNAHVACKGLEIREKYGSSIGWKALQRLLKDPSCVRYPCEVVFDSMGLHRGECAHPVPKGERPEEGYTMFVHPLFLTQLDKVPHLVLYQLVLVNYGDFASAEDAEVFGANALGLPKDDYYRGLCQLADQLGGGDIDDPVGSA